MENSKPVPAERKKIEPVVKRPARLKKKTGLADVFISEDISNVKNYVFGDILIPTIKNTIVDIITDSISMLILGESRGSRRKSRADSVSYTKYYEPNRSSRSDYTVVRKGSYTEVEVDTEEEAKDVLDRMDEIIETYGMVSVLDMYELARIKGGHYTDDKYGWTSTRDAEIIRGRGCCIIKMPKASPLK